MARSAKYVIACPGFVQSPVSATCLAFENSQLLHEKVISSSEDGIVQVAYLTELLTRNLIAPVSPEHLSAHPASNSSGLQRLEET